MERKTGGRAGNELHNVDDRRLLCSLLSRALREYGLMTEAKSRKQHS
jgi:hypothetical protein